MTVAGATVNAKTHQGQDNPIPTPEGAKNNTNSHVHLCPEMNHPALSLLQGDWGKEGAFLNHASYTTWKMEIQTESSRSGEALGTRASCCQNPQPTEKLGRWEVLSSCLGLHCSVPDRGSRLPLGHGPGSLAWQWGPVRCLLSTVSYLTSPPTMAHLLLPTKRFLLGTPYSVSSLAAPFPGLFPKAHPPHSSQG